MARESTPVIGVTGGIGSGKSTVARILAGDTGLVIDADKWGHEALRQPEIAARVIAEFGHGVLSDDNSINRKALGALVFHSPEKRAALEAIVHPWIRQRIASELARGRHSGEYRVVVLDAPLLIEGGWKDHVDAIVHVDAPFQQRLERVRERGWDEEMLKLREKAQIPLTEKRANADYIINNSGGFESLCEQSQAIVKVLELR